jgi:GT2 family glycosyltransferase
VIELHTSYPKVSIIWVNYNSFHIIDIIKESLKALMMLNYPNYEVIIVDNGSTDGSREIIEDYIKQVNTRGIKVKFLKLSKNFGFTGGVNVAYRARDKESKYVAIVNNDAIPSPDYLNNIVTFLEEHNDIGAIQGVVLKRNKPVIDSAAMYIDEALGIFAPFTGKPVSAVSKLLYVSYVEGAMPVYRVDAVKRALKGNENDLYISSAFAYYLEDIFISLMLWNAGYKCVLLPIVVGKHNRGSTIDRYRKIIGIRYYSIRNVIALLYMTNSLEKRKVILRFLRRAIISKRGLAFQRIFIDCLIDGLRLGKFLLRKYGMIDIYKAPLMRRPLLRRIII